jgi:hypothetical protein
VNADLLDAEPDLTELTIGWGEDTFCAACLCALPAGAPAWAAGTDQPLCADCAP